MLTVRSTINIAGQAVPNIIPAVQGDTGRSIEFTLADFTIPAGATANYYIQKPSGEAVYNAAEIVDNTVIVNLTAQSLAETGDNYGQVRILNGEDVVTSFDFILLVKPFRGIEAIESTTEMNIFDRAVQNAMANIDGMLPNIIAPVFNTSTAYTAGDYVIYSGKLYQFTSAHTGAWTGADAVKCTVTEKLATNTQNITSLKEDFNDIFENKTIPPSPTLISEIDGINVKTGYNASDGSISIAMSPSSSYDSYWFVTQTDVDVWFSSISAGYFAFIVGGAYQSTRQSGSSFFVYCQNGATRYRKSDGNLPTESNKIHIPAGCAVAFTMTAGAMESIYGLTESGAIKVVKDSFKAEVVKRNYLKYVGGSGADSSIEKVEIYIPTVFGYTRYDFLHTVSESINSDVWRVGYAYHVDDSFAIDYPLTTAGEWECAIKLSGRDDFSGGYAHGDEVMNNVLFVVNGKPVDITTIITMTSFDDLCIVEDSNLYDPSDHTTVYAKHGSEHHFTVDGLTIRQTIKFVLAETVLTAYLAMLPIAKTISNKVIPDNTFVPLSTDSAIRIYDTEKVIICKTDGKVKADFSVPMWEYWRDDDFTFLCLDNGSSSYNKCYFVNTLSTISIPQNKIFKSETKYNFVISE